MGVAGIDISDLIGQKVCRVECELGGEEMELILEGGEVASFYVEGDCCSRSWIEHVEAPPDLDGATLSDLVEMDGPGDDCEAERLCSRCSLLPEADRYHDCVKSYMVRFRTDRGDISVEFRNDSNGYYGGYFYRAGPRA